MSKQINDIAQAMASFSSRFGPLTILPAKAGEFNEEDNTIKVLLDSGLEIPDARLKSVVKGGGKVILVPVKDSVVQIARIENSDEFIVVAVDEVSQVLYCIDKTVMKMDSKGYLLKKDDETLRKIMDDLLDGIMNMRFTTQSGPTVNLVNRTTFEQIKNRVEKLLKDAE
ncbi:hypothetical protein CLV59_109150 [Chitinophaga dinghuensis]|uniref:Uncharacterized protein n=1 Tax=Chitinophaga dinghuensis TaxID=1539050 RepID=A0A327VP44_9BACT|nr:hypothetical protein [Chitinophaga dinghuensis]RAJ75536.1 hypothetical protein CLV59_109150 [Chitinophaga dinghuensis]